MPPILAGLIAAATLATSLAASATPQAFTFSQTGYADDARVTGWFIADDANDDGWILPYEVINLSLSFSGNSVVGAFTHSMANGGASGLTYQLGSDTILKYPYGGFITMGGLGDNESTDSIRFSMWEWEAEWLPGAVTDLHRRVTTYTEDPFLITAVPEPGSWALMAAGLASIGFLARRRRAPGSA